MSNAANSPIRDGELLVYDLEFQQLSPPSLRVTNILKLRVIDRLRDSVRLAAGLRSDGSLEPARRDKALASLARFGQRLRVLPPGRVRAVATNTVRRLAEPASFLGAAEQALGHPIEVVSGREEARLIYLGVAHGIADSPERRLVIDIGGGSTEFIIGQHFEALEKESLQMGCIASTQRFFGDGKLSPQALEADAGPRSAVEFQQFAADYRSQGWGETIGSSGHRSRRSRQRPADRRLVRIGHHAQRARAHARCAAGMCQHRPPAAAWSF